MISSIDAGTEVRRTRWRNGKARGHGGGEPESLVGACLTHHDFFLAFSENRGHGRMALGMRATVLWARRTSC